MSLDLTVVLPSFLEEENLRLLLIRIKDHFKQLTSNFEILVVDSMTPKDGTPEVCRDIGVTYMNREGGNTYGDSIRTGISRSKGAKVIFMDADGSHPPSVLDELYLNKDKAEIVVASRYVKGSYTENNRISVLMSLIVNIGYRLVLSLKCKNVSNSFKLYPNKSLRGLSLKCNNFDIQKPKEFFSCSFLLTLLHYFD